MPRDVPPFSCGTEAMDWMYNWCDRCLVDAPYRNGMSKTGCPLIAVAVCDGQTPDEWFDGPRDERGAYAIESMYTCINFRAPGSGSPDPKPRPVPPGQGTLADVQPHRRVLTTAPEPALVAAS